MTPEEAQRILKALDTKEHDERLQRIDAALAKAARGVSARGGRVKTLVRKALVELGRLTRLGQRRQMVQGLWRQIALSFLRYLFGRKASDRILAILERQEQQADVRIAQAETLCKSLLIISHLKETREEIDLVREAIKALSENSFSKLGDAAVAINARMENLDGIIKLVGSITSANYNIHSSCDKHYHDFENLLKEDYHQLALEDNYPQEAEAYVNLQGVLTDMGNIRLAPRLATRNMCAVAGGFSSGKSSFLNSLIGGEDDLLPTRITPTTSIATYIFHIKGEEQSINVFNHNGGSVKIKPAQFQRMTHDFKAEYGIQLKRLVERVSIYTPKLADWNNVALIDTPGYTNPDEGEGVDSDEEIALRSVWKSRFLIWLVDCERGTLPEQDVELLRKFLQQRDRPKGGKSLYLVVNKADKKPEDELEGVLQKVAKTAQGHDIPCFGIGLYSAHQGKWYSHTGQPFEEFLSKVSEAELANIETLKDRVKQVFDGYVDWHRAEQERLANTLGLMNLLLLGVDLRQSKNNSGEKKEAARGRRGNSPSNLEGGLNKHIRALRKQIEVHKQWSEKAIGLRARFLRSVEGFIKEINLLRDLR